MHRPRATVSANSLMPRRTDQPLPGYYTLRLCRGGPPVAAQIVRDDNGQWWAMVDDVWTGPVEDPFTLEMIDQIHSYGQEASESEVRYRIDLKRWAVAYAPMHPAANPRRPVNSDVLLPF